MPVGVVTACSMPVGVVAACSMPVGVVAAYSMPVGVVTVALCIHTLQAQTRSADEPMTTFALCNDCGHRWKVSYM